MTKYLPDTNVLINFGHDAAVRARFEEIHQSGSTFVIGPPALTELVRGMINGGPDGFEVNKEIFVWLHNHNCPILELPRPFMATILHSSTRNSGVLPQHYQQLVQMIVQSADLQALTDQANAPGSVWRELERSDEIHREELDKELGQMEMLAKRPRGAVHIATLIATTFGIPGCRPKPLILMQKFSAAVEFLVASLSNIREGAKPWKNDRGLYVDFNLLVYLADEHTTFLTGDKKIAPKVTKSPQKERIRYLAQV